MNRNEFYKQLMSEYSFNDERIKSNARKGKYAKQRNLPLFIGVTAAAAVCTVAIGTSAMLLNDSHGVSLIPESDGLAALSANERLQKALEEIEKNADSTELHDVLVTFASPFTADEVRALLTSYSESIPVKQLYFADGTKAAGEEQVGAAFSSGAQITGAVINCEGAMMKSLQNDSRVFSVEIVTESDLESVAPIDTEAAETVEVTVPDNSGAVQGPVAPSEPDQVLVVTGESGDETEQEDFETGEAIGDVVLEDTEESDDTLDAETVEDTTAETAETVETAEPVITDPMPTDPMPTEPDTPVPAEVSAGGIPAGVTLPDKADKLSYECSYNGAETAFFFSDNCYFVKTADSVMLYGFDGVSEKLIASAECPEAKVVWVSDNSGKLIVSGVNAEGMRNKLLLINAGSGSIIDLRAEDTVMDGTLASAAYNEDSRLLVMNIKENDAYYVCTASLNANGNVSYLTTCFESDSRVTLLAAYENNVYLSVNHGGLTQIFRADAVNGGSSLVKTYDSNPTISKNLAFTHAVIAPSDSAVIGFTEIFDPVTESFIRTDVFNDSITFGASKHSFCVNGAYYTLNNGSIAQTDNVSVISKVEYRKGLSALYSAAASDGRVKITESVYTNSAKNDPLAYGELADNCSAELREAANRAIGLTNVLALNKCSESGIFDLKTLNECISAVYTDSAAAELKSLCGISDYGALRFNGSALTAVTAADTRLVITSKTDVSASGILYVKAGTIGGRTAFFAKPVSFAYENGAWKLDSVLK